jgi:hypothetical protein
MSRLNGQIFRAQTQDKMSRIYDSKGPEKRPVIIRKVVECNGVEKEKFDDEDEDENAEKEKYHRIRKEDE